MTVVRPELHFGVAELDGDGRVAGFREKPRSEHWINGGFFVFEPGVFDYLRDDERARARAARAASRPTASCTRSATTGFWECMDTYKDAVALNDLWAGGRGAVGSCRRHEPRARHRRLRPARAVARARAARRAATGSSSLRRDVAPGSGAGARGRSRARVDVVHGDLLERAWSPRALGEYEVDTVFHLAAQTIVGTAQPLAAPTFESTCAAPGPCWRHAARTASQRVVVASSDKAYGAERRAALPRGPAARAALPVRRLARRRPT